MKRQKLRVLLDLSMTLHGYSGIPQDARLMYKTLSMSPDVELTGLIYSSAMHVRQHRFKRAGAPLAERLANQAVYLWALSQDHMHWPAFRPWRWAKKAQHHAGLLLKRRARLDRLEVDKFWHTIWRLMFTQSLSAKDIPLVQNGKFLLSDICSGMIHLRGKRNLSPLKLDTRGYDFLIVQCSRPFRISPGTKQIVRHHDMIPMLQPDTRPNWMDIAWSHKSLRQSLSAHFVCNSGPTHDSLLDVYPQLHGRSSTVPYMLSESYYPEINHSRVGAVINNRRSPATGAKPRRPLKGVPRYVLSVSTLEPRKNYIGLIQAFIEVKARAAVTRAVPKLKLVIVGGPGWRSEPILAAMRPFIESGDVIHLENLAPDEMRVLYTHAEAFVFPSHAEGFGFPPLEAMQCDVPVIVSDVQEHRWVMGDAALYCNSYDTSSIADAIERLVAAESSLALRTELIARGRERVKRYSLERCSHEWVDLLYRLRDMPAAAGAQTTARWERDRDQRGLMDQAA